jgi:hypothetical protein
MAKYDVSENEKFMQEKAEFNSKFNMPELTGDKNKIEWADNVRFIKLTEVQELFDKNTAKMQKLFELHRMSLFEATKIEVLYNSIFEYLKGQEKAIFWINNCDKSAYDIANFAKMVLESFAA